ncbi:MAG: ABC transporter permease [Thermodesulfobacteriota bacterium]|nr:ABC transporter permease [Thermodesulfobacteriota bacterium]
MRSIKQFIYKDPKDLGLNAVFDREYTSLKYELIGLFIFVLLWIILSFIFFLRPGFEHFHGFLPGPAFMALCHAVAEPGFWVSVWASLQRIVAGISLAALFGIPVGFAIGFYPKMRILTYSPIQFLRMISPLSWMPVALLVFASFESAVVFLIVMATIWPIILNVSIGVMNINPQWIKMAMNQGADNVQLMRTIVMPSSLPYVITSFRLALGVAWIVLVPAEFLGVTSGLGYLINDARDTMEYDRLMAMIIVIGILGFILDRILQKIQTLFNSSFFE